MTAQLDSGGRDVIPRWRSVRRTIEAGEFQTLSSPKALKDRQVEDMESAKRRWVRRHTEIAAAELVGIDLLSHGALTEVDPVNFLLEKGSNSILRHMAKAALDGRSQEVSEGIGELPVSGLPKLSEHFFFERIRRDKVRIRRDPRNAIAWADLARRYTALGQFEQADRSLRIAMSLAPSSRYLHRVASRFYVHVGRPDAAFGLLNKWERTFEDPWLMAALLAVASAGEIPLRSLKPARRIVDRGEFRSIETAELVSEVATLELRDGHDKKARTLFRRSLGTPTDNSLAQAEWASHQIAHLSVPLDSLNVPFAAEAHARSAAEAGDWTNAYEYALRWLDDQPFDTDAAIFGSYIAAVAFEDWKASANIAAMGLRAQPREALLQNNLAYALVQGNHLEQASDVLEEVDLSSASTEDQIALTATTGLLHLRMGDEIGGAKLYRQAIESARRRGLADLEAMASSIYLKEAVITGGRTHVADLVNALRTLTQSVQDQAVLLCVRRTTQLLESADTDPTV